jgi:DNA-binding NtrC family response regulator
MEELPARLAKAFASANFQIKKTADAIVALVKEKQWPGAAMQLQALLSNTTLSKEQRDVATQALLTVNGALKEQSEALAGSAPAETAAAPGDASPKPQLPPPSTEEAAAAAAVREHYLRTK